MDQQKYAKQERQNETAYELADAMPRSIKRVQIRGFPRGDLFSMLHPEYRSFQEIEINWEN